MDIFSATNKQVTQPSIETSTNMSTNTKKDITYDNNINLSNSEKKVSMPSKEELKNTIENLNKHMDSLDTNVKFGFDDKIEQMFVNVMERSTGKIIRKIPSEEAMKISEKMREIVGIIFDKKG